MVVKKTNRISTKYIKKCLSLNFSYSLLSLTPVICEKTTEDKNLVSGFL
jgi:hypothetical protein